ncbi:MAG: class I SAM-dependent methyltransferase [Magnetococcales bacterium]|nr:class I SAM-dependent methyltransferase [Magnetococcales bacterium]
MEEILTLTVAQFLEAFDADPEDGEWLAEEIARYDFRYRRLSQEERDALILSVLDRLDGFTQVGAHRQHIWELAWGDVADRYERSRGDLSALEPGFIGATREIRLRGDFAVPMDPKFEFHFFRVFRHWLYRKHLGAARQVYEFGCGSGFNLAALAQRAPDKVLTGLDWAQPAVDLINAFARKQGFNLTGRRFDFFNPDPELKLEPGAVVMTFCALEQTGVGFRDFIDWLLERQPERVISMEPVLEFYDPARLYDALALRYHRHRNYLNGYYTYIRELAAAGRVEILKARRLQYGSLFHEGTSMLIWRPISVGESTGIRENQA